MRRLLALLLCIFLIPFAHAYTSAEIYLSSDGSATFVGRTSSQPEIEGIELRDGKLVGVTQQLTKKEGEKWTFSVALNDTTEIRIFLPENAILNAESIISNEEVELISLKEEIMLSLAGANPQISFNYELGAQSKDNLAQIILILTTILVITLLFYILEFRKARAKREQTKSKKNKPKLSKIKIIKKTLNERELQIINKLTRTGGLKHSSLQKALGIPKASFSRHVNNLVKKGLLVKKGQGKNNILEINKSLL